MIWGYKPDDMSIKRAIDQVQDDIQSLGKYQIRVRFRVRVRVMVRVRVRVGVRVQLPMEQPHKLIIIII